MKIPQFQKWPNSADADSGRVRAQTLQKHRDVTGEHECMNWKNEGLDSTDDENK